MWITCNDAVNRYDGKTVKVYNLNKYFKDCPNLQQGYGIVQDDEADIYIGSIRGLYTYHRGQDKFTLQKIFSDVADNVAMPFACKDGKVWCYNSKYEIATYEVATGRVTYITRFAIPPIPSVHIYQIVDNVFYYRQPFIDNQNNIWVIGEKEIAGYNTLSRKMTYPLEDYLKKNKCSLFCSDYDSSSGTLYCGTQNGILKIDLSSLKPEQITLIANKKIGMVNNLCARKDILVIRSDLLGLAFIGDNRKILWREPAGQGLYSKCNQFGFDKSNRLWICDDGQGQIIFDFNPLLLNKVSYSIADMNLTRNFGVTVFSETPDSNIIIQSALIQNKTDKSLHPFHLPGTGNRFHRSLSDKYRQGVWFFREAAVQQPGAVRIFFYDKYKKTTAILTQDKAEQLGLLQDMQVLTDGRIICSFSKGLFWLNTETKALERIKGADDPGPFRINLLSHNKIAVSYLNNNMLLFSVLPDNRLQMLQKLLPGVQSFYMQEDTLRKYYWVGTNKGVYLLDQHFNTVKLFDANNGLAGTYIYGLLLDNEGLAWCSHQRGLSSINPKTFQVINYDKSDGIQEWDFNNRAFYKASDGTLYFGGVNGFNYFKPPLKPYSFYSPEIYVDEIKVNNKFYLPDINANLVQHMNLAFLQNNIAIKVLVKDLGSASARQIIYRIKEIKEHWTVLPNNNVLLFNSLAPGAYTVEIGIYDKFENRANLQKTILINIALPLYRKIWFWFLVAVLLTAVVLGFLSRIRFTRQQRVFQQYLALEQQRNKITADLHDDIGASLSSLQINSAVAGKLMDRDPLQARQLLEKVEEQSRNLADKIGDIIWSMKPGKEEFITMSNRIRNFANDILEAGEMKYEIQISKEVDTRITDIAIRKNIVFLTKEAINNAVKYSGASLLNISLVVEGQVLQLQVSDNGCGFVVNETSGNGIANMRKRAEEINAHLNISSGKGMGTTITVHTPIPIFNDKKFL
jgi:signal transduction histidine kinase/ligand-binding sensor domain-containing protein